MATGTAARNAIRPDQRCSGPIQPGERNGSLPYIVSADTSWTTARVAATGSVAVRVWPSTVTAPVAGSIGGAACGSVPSVVTTPTWRPSGSTTQPPTTVAPRIFAVAR